MAKTVIRFVIAAILYDFFNNLSSVGGCFFIVTRIRNFYEIPYNLQYHADLVTHARA